MPTIDHVNIHTRDPDTMRTFLTSVLGVEEGYRPPFSNPGHWLYLEGRAVIHLNNIERDTDFPAGILNHVAFGVYEPQETRAKLEASGYPFHFEVMPATGIGQFFVTGPEGVRIELQCRPAAG